MFTWRFFTLKIAYFVYVLFLWKFANHPPKLQANTVCIHRQRKKNTQKKILADVIELSRSESFFLNRVNKYFCNTKSYPQFLGFFFLNIHENSEKNENKFLSFAEDSIYFYLFVKYSTRDITIHREKQKKTCLWFFVTLFLSRFLFQFVQWFGFIWFFVVFAVNGLCQRVSLGRWNDCTKQNEKRVPVNTVDINQYTHTWQNVTNLLEHLVRTKW